MANRLTLTIKNGLEGLEAVGPKLDAFIEEHGLPAKSAYVIQLAVEEMVSNIIKYAFDDPADHDILLELRPEPDHVVVHVEDDGHEFNPADAPEPDTGASLADREIGGLGIHLIRSMADAVDYTRVRGRNILDVRVRIDPDV